MQLLEIKKYPQKILRKKCVSLSRVTQREKTLFEQMLFAMKYFSGIGLAAPQVGILRKMIVVEVEGRITKLANPQILRVKGADVMEERCLSVPGLGVDIVRPYEAIIKGLNEEGQAVEIKAKGLFARVLQHEIDHLCGKLIVDYLSFWQSLKFKVKALR